MILTVIPRAAKSLDLLRMKILRNEFSRMAYLYVIKP